MVTPIKVLIFNDLHKYFNTYFADYQQVNHKLNELLFMNAVIYTHRNPVHHAFCDRYTDWSYTSFCEIKEHNSQLIEVDKLLRIFGGLVSFIDLHEQSANKFRESLIADL